MNLANQFGSINTKVMRSVHLLRLLSGMSWVRVSSAPHQWGGSSVVERLRFVNMIFSHLCVDRTKLIEWRRGSSLVRQRIANPYGGNSTLVQIQPSPPLFIELGCACCVFWSYFDIKRPYVWFKSTPLELLQCRQVVRQPPPKPAPKSISSCTTQFNE